MIQQAISDFLNGMGFKAIARDVLLVADHDKAQLSKYARLTVKNLTRDGHINVANRAAALFRQAGLSV